MALTNGNYLVRSPHWSGPGNVNYAGAVTWGNGVGGTTGVVSATNSLVGSSANDQVGDTSNGAVIALSNGNYLVLNPVWDNGPVVDAGAITWGNGTIGSTGVVSAANSLVGSTVDDQLGGDWWNGTVTILTNGSYVVSAPQWDNGGVIDAGDVTWGNGAGGSVGPLSASNSLVGSKTGDMGVEGHFGGDFNVIALTKGDYVVNSPRWDNLGSVTWGMGPAELWVQYPPPTAW